MGPQPSFLLGVGRGHVQRESLCVIIQPIGVGANSVDWGYESDIFTLEISAIAPVALGAIFGVDGLTFFRQRLIDGENIFRRLEGLEPLLDAFDGFMVDEPRQGGRGQGGV